MRGVWETVWVQVPSTAPSGKQLLSTTIKVVFFVLSDPKMSRDGKRNSLAGIAGFFAGSAVTDGMGGAILFSMIAGIGCIVYAADNRDC